MSAGNTARSTLAAVHGDRVRALRHVLYRAARTDRTRRFHALRDKVHREDVLQRAVKIVLEPVFEADFLPASFGFRPQRSAHDALQVLINEAWQGRRWVAETDIANCFSAIPQDKLMQAVEERVSDQAVLTLLRGWGGYFRYGNSARIFDAISQYALERLAGFVAKRHKRSPRWGMRLVTCGSPDNFGRITLCGTVIAPRPFRPWRAPAECRR